MCIASKHARKQSKERETFLARAHCQGCIVRECPEQEMQFLVGPNFVSGPDGQELACQNTGEILWTWMATTLLE